MNSCGLRQIIKEPTSAKAILDKVYTNMDIFYASPQVHAPVGRSDYCVVVCPPLLERGYKAP